MDYDAIGSGDFGRSLSGIGINMLVRDVHAQAQFLNQVFGMNAHQATKDFAIVTYGSEVFQLHADSTYHSHPLPSLLPEAGARGAGMEIRLYDTDPDEAAAKAEAAGGHILEAPTNKPHGLRECFILDADGYCWVPSRWLTDEEETALG